MLKVPVIYTSNFRNQYFPQPEEAAHTAPDTGNDLHTCSGPTKAECITAHSLPFDLPDIHLLAGLKVPSIWNPTNAGFVKEGDSGQIDGGFRQKDLTSFGRILPPSDGEYRLSTCR